MKKYPGTPLRANSDVGESSTRPKTYCRSLPSSTIVGPTANPLLPRSRGSYITTVAAFVFTSRYPLGNVGGARRGQPPANIIVTQIVGSSHAIERMMPRPYQ